MAIRLEPQALGPVTRSPTDLQGNLGTGATPSPTALSTAYGGLSPEAIAKAPTLEALALPPGPGQVRVSEESQAELQRRLEEALARGIDEAADPFGVACASGNKNNNTAVSATSASKKATAAAKEQRATAGERDPQAKEAGAKDGKGFDVEEMLRRMRAKLAQAARSKSEAG